MRTFTNTLLFEQAIDLVPSGNVTYTYLQSIFNPVVKIVENDCGTLLGRKTPLTLDLLGQTWLSTNTGITLSFIVNQSNAGTTSVFLRTANTCISQNGLCVQCYRATFPADTVPTVGAQVTIPCEFIIQQDVIVAMPGDTTINLAFDTSQYDRVYIYQHGTRIDPTTYSISGTTVTFTVPLTADVINTVTQPTVTVTARYAVNTTTPFVHWLASTYSGSLVGLLPIPTEPFPIKPSLYTYALPGYSVDALTTSVLNSPITPSGISDYIPKIRDPLEKAVLVSLLNSIYLV